MKLKHGNKNGTKPHVLYMVVDLRHNEIPLCVGHIKDIMAYTGKSRNAILSAISHAKKRGTRSQYIRIYDENDDT